VLYIQLFVEEEALKIDVRQSGIQVGYIGENSSLATNIWSSITASSDSGPPPGGRGASRRTDRGAFDIGGHVGIGTIPNLKSLLIRIG
jgi:hypothetical protein